jgi:Tol biopolymer transport system component
MRDYQQVLSEADAGLTLWPDNPVFQNQMFCALTALGDYVEAETVYQGIVNAGPEAVNRHRSTCARFVFDNLHASRPWHPADPEPVGPAFLAMLEAEEVFRAVSAKARRLTTDGFSAHWSADGKKLAFSLGFIGYSGVAIYDPATRETELLIVPGKDPIWSPDGQYIAFVRDCRVLRIPELVTAERKNQHRPTIDEEVWIMKADGTEPRRLAQGSWPSWSLDSTHVYYFSREGGRVLCSVSLGDTGAEPKPIWAGWNATPAVSPDDRKVAYLENDVLKVKDRDSLSILAQWRVPPSAWGGMVWSPDGNEICMGACDSLDSRTGLWIYRLDRGEAAKTLDGAIGMGSWAPDGTNMVFSLGAGGGCGEIWTAELDPNASAIDILGPARSLEEHFRETVAVWTRRIEANPQDPNACWRRAGYNSLLHERIQADADMRQWSAIMSAKLPSGSSSAASPSLTRVSDTPSGRRVVFSEGFALGEAINLGPLINSPAREQMPCISPDGLELYFSSHRPGGYGRHDIWVAKRTSVQDPWDPPFNPGPPLNTESYEAVASMSDDGLTLYLEYGPGKHGSQDLATSTRATKDAPWGPRQDLGAVVNSPYTDSQPIISSDGEELHFTSNRPDGSGSLDIWVSRRAVPGGSWGKPENLGSPINTLSQDWCGWISRDGLTALLASNRPGGPAETEAWMSTWDSLDIWKITRPSKNSLWGAPTNLGPSINTKYTEFLTSVSPDGRWCYFESNRPGGYGRGDIWQAQIIPILEVNDERMMTGKEQQ